MAAAASKQYKTDFLIGAKLLGSFKSVISQAQARMHGLQAAARRMAGSVLSFVGKLASGIGLLAGLGLGAVMHSIFGDAAKEAAEAEQRTRRLSFSLMQHAEIQKKGLGYAKKQTELIFQHNEALGKQSVISTELLDSMSTQLAVAGYGPKAIADMAEPMRDVLVVGKGVTATQEDSIGLAKAWGVAAKTGMTRGMREYGFILSKNQQKEFRGLKTAEERNKWILEWSKNFKGAAAEAGKTDLGKIQMFHNTIRAISKDIGKEMLPAQAAMAEAWTTVLPQLKPLAIGAFKAIAAGVVMAAGYVKSTLIPAFLRFIAFLRSGPVVKAAAAIWNNFKGALSKIGAAFKNLFGNLMPASAAKMSWGDIIIAALNGVADAIKWVGDNASWLVPLVTGLVVAFEAISVALTVASAAVGVFSAVLAISPLGWVLIGIAALVAGLIYLHARFGTVTNALSQLWEWLKKIPGVGPILEAFWTNLTKSWSQFIAALNSGWQSVKDGAVAVGNAIYNAFMTPIHAITNEWGKMVEGFKNRPTWLGGTGGTAAPVTPALPMAGAHAAGGIVAAHSLAEVAERGPEAIIPLGGGPRAEGLLNYASRAIGMGRPAAGATNVSFAPNITINGNAGPGERAAMENSVRSMARDFITQFKAAQTQERRLSYESGYA